MGLASSLPAEQQDRPAASRQALRRLCEKLAEGYVPSMGTTVAMSAPCASLILYMPSSLEPHEVCRLNERLSAHGWGMDLAHEHQCFMTVITPNTH